MKNELIAVGRVESLSRNSLPTHAIDFSLHGPENDRHNGFSRTLSGHDGAYIRTSQLNKGAQVFNWRSWTALAREEITEIEETLGVSIPQGLLLENIVFSGIPHFSKLAPTTRLVFPQRHTQAILTIWEENTPCHVVGDRLADHHRYPGLGTKFIRAAQNRRGVMGFVLSAGHVRVGDEVRVYPPAE